APARDDRRGMPSAWRTDRSTPSSVESRFLNSAVDLALPGRMPADLGQPELAGAAAAELPLDEVPGGRDPGNPSPLAGAVAAGDPGSLHQHRDRVVPDPDPAPERQ